jgi:RNA polymerase sigma factor (sigma-70 family)
LLGYLYRLVRGNRQLAEDLVQETFVQILKQDSYLPGHPFKPWLYAIATNLVRDHYRAADTRRRDLLDAEEVAQIYDLAPGPEELAVAADQGKAVAAALEQLGEEYRAALILRFYDRLSLQEMAGALNVPLGTVKSRLSVGTRRLRELLAAYEGDMLPFVATEAVARDHRARVHELLMACAVPSWAYVCGRYLAGLIVSLGLALIALVAVLMTSPFLHLTLAGYPAPDIGLIFTIWAVAVLPATILLTSLGFTLGTLWPRLASIIKIVIMVGWVAILFGADVFDHGSTWFTYWSPTSYGIVRVNVDQFLKNYQALVPSVPDVNQHSRLALQLQQQLPDLQPWLFPHAALVVLGIALVALAALRFQRFRNVME